MISHEQEIEIKNKMIEAKNDQIVKLEMEIDRLRSELEYIANAQRGNFSWAQNRARHALGQEAGTLTVKKS